jgi:hypothetical protein
MKKLGMEEEEDKLNLKKKRVMRLAFGPTWK